MTSGIGNSSIYVSKNFCHKVTVFRLAKQICGVKNLRVSGKEILREKIFILLDVLHVPVGNSLGIFNAS